MYGKEYSQSQTETARFAKLLGHPIRVAIVQMLTQSRELTFGEIASALPVTNATVTQHMQMFKDAGLVRARFDQPFMRYSLIPERIAELKNILGSFLEQI